ncbi:hypothetical protein ETC05_14350 [Geobacillus sp. BMUD]|nr:hypothetical protein [Geobacillus sp. BMUD]
MTLLSNFLFIRFGKQAYDK